MRNLQDRRDSPDTTGVRTSRSRGDTGASLVEFTLILPVMAMLLLGMFTGGLAYTRKQSISHATREAARFGATLPLATEPTLDGWLDRVGDVLVTSADGELDPNDTGVVICVAHITSGGAARRMEQVGLAAPTFSSTPCFADGRTGEARVQVTARRTSKFEVFVWSRDLNLAGNAVSRFES